MNPYTFLRRESARVRALSWQCLTAFTLMTGVGHFSTQAAPAALLTNVGTFSSDSNMNDAQVVGKTAYVAGGDEGLLILDASDPTHLVRIGVYDTPTHAYAVQVIGNRAYVSDFEGGLQIIDVSDPTSPFLLGSFVPGTMVQESRIVGNRAYLACSEGGLQIVDISDPANPVKLGEYVNPDDPFSFSASNLRVSGDLVYLAYNGLEIVDVSDPTQPKPLSVWNKGYVADVEVVGKYAYVAATGDGLIVFDVTDPTQPKRVTRIPAPGFCVSVHVEGSLAYTSAGIYDVSDPVTPVRLGAIDTPTYVPHFDLEGDLVYFPSGTLNLEILKVHFGSPQTLQWQGFSDVILPDSTPMAAAVTSSSGLPVQVEVLAGPATFAGGQLKITGPGKVLVKASQAGDAQYLPAQETRLINQLYSQLADVSRFGFETNIFGARIVGNRAYVGNDVLGLHILDVSDPAKPLQLGTVAGTNQIFEADVVGNLAYIAAGDGGFRIADVSNPAKPQVIGSLDLKLTIAVTVSGQYAYVSDFGTRKFRIIDISNPSDPKQVAEIDAQGEPRFTLIQGNRAYFAAGSGGVFIYDVTTPAEPKLIQRVYRGSQVRGVAVVGDILYIPEYGFSKLIILNIADPTNPVELGRFDLVGNPRRIRIEGTQAFVVTEAKGLQVVDISDPAHLQVMAQLDTGGYARDIEKVGNLIYVADQNQGLRIVQLKETGFQPTVSFNPPSALAFGTGATLNGSSSSGQTVQFSVVSGPGRLENGQLIPTGLGLISVRASVASRGGYMSGAREAVVQSTLPALTFQRGGDSLQLSWPAGLPYTVLEQADSFDNNASWKSVSSPVTEVNGVAQTAVPMNQPSGFVRLRSPYSGTAEPLSLTGWNRDVVMENAPNPVAEPFGFDDSTWFEDGLDGYFNGLPASGRIVDQHDPHVVFQLQPYSAKNALVLDESESTATLTLATPVACSKLNILAATPFERSSSGTFVVKYVDGTVSQPKSFLAHTWIGLNIFGEPIPSVFPPVGKSFSGDEFNYVRGDFGFTMYQTEVDLSSEPQAGKAIAALEFTRVDEPGYMVGIFAVSGIVRPSSP